MVIALRIAIALNLASWATSAHAAECADVLPTLIGSSGKPRAIALSDLSGLRDIGQPDPSVGGPSPLAVSPEGRRVAFVLSRGDPIANRVCQGLVVVDLSGRTGPRLLDTGDEQIRAENVIRASRTPSGLPATIVPAWSPDGREIAYLKRSGGRTQVWRVGTADGGNARVATDAPVDVEDVAWSADGSRIVFATRPGRQAFAAARAAESRGGYLVDARVIPANGPGPQLPADLPRASWTVPAHGGNAAIAAAADTARLGDETRFDLPAPLAAMNGAGRRAGVEAEGPSPYAGRRIWADGESGQRIACVASACVGALRGIWWHPDGRQLLFLRYEGWNNEMTALYRWQPGASEPHRIFATDAALLGCAPAGDRMLCLHESALSPRRMVSIGLGSGVDSRAGTMKLVFDPNPEFASVARPRVERLRWRNPAGLPAWGDLVLPDGTKPKTGWPLVIVQYTSRGFLRGGTGDEYPILAFAAHGIAVLSFQRPPTVAQSKPQLTETAAVSAILTGNAERRNTQASLEAGLARLFARGDIDRARVGITGLSDGATTARYALIAGMSLRAAALSTCCRYQRSDLSLGGIAVADYFRGIGFPSITDRSDVFWTPLSLPQAADRLTTPLLLQVSDEEWLFSLETFMALREHGIPVELRVFPDERHLKWQPAHRAAIYERSLDWFRFWLNDEQDNSPAKAEQYRRWRMWRDRPPPASPSAPRSLP